MKEDKNIEKMLTEDKDFNITLDQYMNYSNLFNMYGYQLKFIKDGLRAKYLTLVNKYGKFKYNIAKSNIGYVLHVIIPSESVTNLLYDVIVELEKPEEIDEKNILKYDIKFFCNSPSFTFGFAYVMNDNGIFATDYSDKLDKIFLEKAPIDKNPGLSIGYEKFTYMALCFLDDEGLLDYSNLEKLRKVSAKDIHKVVVDAETKLKEYKLKEKAMSDNEKFLKRKTKSKTLSSRTTSFNNLKGRTKISSKGEHGNNSGHKIDKLMNGKKGVKKSSKITPKKKITGKKKIGR